MLNSLNIENFRCIRGTRFSLAPLTVLIGPNDSGKTTILDAIQRLGRLTTRELVHVFSGDHSIENITWRRTKEARVRFSLDGNAGDAGDFSWTFAFSAGPHIHDDTIHARGQKLAERNGDTTNLNGRNIHFSQNHVISSFRLAQTNNCTDPFEAIRAALASGSIYHLDPSQLRARSVPTAGAVLTPTGDNLASVLDGLLSGPDREAVVEMERVLHDAIPGLKGFAVRPIVGGNQGEKSIEFVLSETTRPALTIPCALASDGAMLLTAFLALAYSDTPEVLLIEEPENGLHPARLKEVIDLLRRMTTGEVGNKRRQIILTTHSPLLLNYARPEEVRIVRRDPELGTQVKAMSDVPGLDMLRQELGLGEIWYLLGEQAMFDAKEPS
jgi:predicted ATPase